ncbi:MAG: hypothetical protein ACXVRE_08335 [Gaiellaceae bacterium]
MRRLSALVCVFLCAGCAGGGRSAARERIAFVASKYDDASRVPGGDTAGGLYVGRLK